MSGGRVVIGMVHSGSAGGDRVDVEQFEDAGLEPGGGGHDGWRVGGGGDEVEPGQRLEDEPAGGSGGGAAGESGHRAFRQDRASGCAFDEAEDQQGEADHRQERVDAAVVLEEHGRDGERAFERAAAASTTSWPFVADEHFCGVGVGGVEADAGPLLALPVAPFLRHYHHSSSYAVCMEVGELSDGDLLDALHEAQQDVPRHEDPKHRHDAWQHVILLMRELERRYPPTPEPLS